jgi:hypothetical protein
VGEGGREGVKRTKQKDKALIKFLFQSFFSDDATENDLTTKHRENENDEKKLRDYRHLPSLL